MPKMQVYLPDELYLRVKTRGGSINVSGLLQEAIEARLAELERVEAQRVAIGQYEKKFGKVSAKERAEQKRKDAANAVYPKAKKPLRSAAA
jgi:post-segregation antitoxin (ccd killing protein)